MGATTESLDAVGQVVDPGCRVQEEIGEILPYMPDSAARTFVEYARSRGPGAPRANVYSGVSAFPLADYKRAQGGDEPVLDGAVVETIGAETVDDRRADYGIDRCVLNPTENLGLAAVNNDRYAVAIARGYNDWLLDQVDGRDALAGNALVAPQAPDRAAAEIDRVADEDDVVGVHLPATGLRPLAGHVSYDPIYEAAAAAGLPVTLYPTVGLKSYHQQYYSAEWFAEDYTYHPSFAHIEHVTSLLFEGVPVRYPDLDFLLQGAGVGFGPYLTQRLDDHYLELGYEIPALDALPSTYLDRQFHWCTSPIGTPSSTDYLPKMIRMLGVENVLYTSDLPHQFGESPAALADRLGEAFDADELAQLLGGNAARLYGF
jgi:predicted TIM-barrel fold metal-dependent hydrolase